MKQAAFVCAVAAILVACSSESTGTTETGCKDITGNYDVTATRLTGSCPKGNDTPDKITVTITSVSGKPNIAFPGIEGGCPGELNPATCKFTALCKITDKAGNQLLQYNVDYTFSGPKVTGTFAGVQYPPVVAQQCDATAKHEGTRL